jgi:hypothetical protein
VWLLLAQPAVSKYIYFNLNYWNILNLIIFLAMLIGESSAGPSNTRQSGEGKKFT